MGIRSEHNFIKQEHAVLRKLEIYPKLLPDHVLSVSDKKATFNLTMKSTRARFCTYCWRCKTLSYKFEVRTKIMVVNRYFSKY